jgi:hypothetical protein
MGSSAAPKSFNWQTALKHQLQKIRFGGRRVPPSHWRNVCDIYDGCQPCDDISDTILLPPPIINLRNLNRLENNLTATSSPLATVSVNLNSSGNSIEDTCAPGRSLGISFAGRAEEEDITHEEEISVYGRKGTERRYSAHSMLRMWSCQEVTSALPLLCER